MPYGFDFITDLVIAYCYKNQVGLYDLDEKYVFRNLHPTKQPYPNRANCVKAFVRDGRQYVVVGYDSGDVIVYGSKDFL